MPGAGHWERKSGLVRGKTPGSGGALQAFGLVIAVTQERAWERGEWERNLGEHSLMGY